MAGDREWASLICHQKDESRNQKLIVTERAYTCNDIPHFAVSLCLIPHNTQRPYSSTHRQVGSLSFLAGDHAWASHACHPKHELWDQKMTAVHRSVSCALVARWRDFAMAGDPCCESARESVYNANETEFRQKSSTCRHRQLYQGAAAGAAAADLLSRPSWRCPKIFHRGYPVSA